VSERFAMISSAFALYRFLVSNVHLRIFIAKAPAPKCKLVPFCVSLLHYLFRQYFLIALFCEPNA